MEYLSKLIIFSNLFNVFFPFLNSEISILHWSFGFEARLMRSYFLLCGYKHFLRRSPVQGTPHDTQHGDFSVNITPV